MIIIRPFRADEWPQYRDVRLKALQDAPDAFGSTWEASLKYSDEVWRERLLKVRPDTDLALAAVDRDQFVGLAWGRIDPANPVRADLFQMWGSPDIRGQGVGRKMLEQVIDWARDQGARYMILGVTAGNIAAERLYTSKGFESFGEPEPLREHSPKLIRNMRLDL